jgi:diguanylate cyclase (GGDEF)-like protein/PAS domain S-box-containing protein
MNNGTTAVSRNVGQTTKADSFGPAFEKEQLEMLYGGATAIFANPIVCAVVAVSLWQVYPRWLLVLWMTLFSVVVVARLLDRKLYLRNPSSHSIKHWRNRVAIGVSVTGLLWGVFGLSAVLMTPDVVYCVLIIFMIGGMLAGGVLLHSAYLPAYYGYAGLAVVPVVTALIARGDWLSISMGAGASVYAVAIGLIGHRNYHRVRDNLLLRVEQTALLADLRTQIAENQLVIDDKRKSEERLQAIFNAVSDAILVYDPETLEIVAVNERVCELFGRAREEFRDWAIADVLKTTSGDSASELLSKIMKARAGQPQTMEWHGKVRDTYSCWLDVNFRRTAFGGRDFLLATIHDITERKEAELQLARMARFDALTELVNRGVFVESLEQAIARARRGHGGFAVLYLDLDHFKNVNDTLGHPIGDRLLRAVAKRLQSVTKPNDTVARFGGDEFAVLTAAIAEPAEAGLLADRLLNAMSRPVRIGNSNIFIGTSIGIAAYQGDTPEAEAILSHADVALYRAKSEGRRGYRFFTSTMESEVRSRFALMAELRDGMANGQLFLKYQPQVEIATGRIVGVEALVRWRHPVRGELLPSEFVSAAEESGLVFELTRWVLHEACRQAREWLDAGIHLWRLAVNVSAVELKKPFQLEAELGHAMTVNRLPSELIELELAETALVKTSRETNDVLRRLRSKGIKLAIDDFGTGYSSLVYLRRFPADRIKVAQDFVVDLDRDSNAAAIARATIGLADILGIDAIAEGVETKDQAHLLQEWGCREAQGFYFGRPEAAQKITTLLRKGFVLSAGHTAQ